MIQKIKTHLPWAVLASEFSHIFCCVLPTIFTVISFAANIGLISTMPNFLNGLHEKIHHYEIPIIIFSGVMVVLGWLAHHMAESADCHDTGCGHPPCSPQKLRNGKILKLATILFVMNLLIYIVIHKNVFDFTFFPQTEIHENHIHD